RKVAERVQAAVERVHPGEVAVHDLDRAELPVADRGGELEGGHVGIEGAGHGRSCPGRRCPPRVGRRPARVLGAMSRGDRRPAPWRGPMSAARPAGGAVPAWEIATPARPLRLPGVGMAGFVDREPGPIDLRVVPHPAVTVVVDVGAGDELYAVHEASGRRQRGTVVAGLAHGSVRGGGWEVACLQVRLSPTVAHQVFGAAAPLAGSVVALEDLWGRDAVRTQERLQAAGSWGERFAVAEAALARRLEVGRPVDPEVGEAWRRIVAARGQVRVEELAAEVGWGRRRLGPRFRAQGGLTPKRAAH